MFRQCIPGRSRDRTQGINLFDSTKSTHHAAGDIKNQNQRIRRYRRCRNPDIGVVNNRRVINDSNLQLRSQRCSTRRFDVVERFNDAIIVCGCRIGSGRIQGIGVITLTRTRDIHHQLTVGTIDTDIPCTRIKIAHTPISNSIDVGDGIGSDATGVIGKQITGRNSRPAARSAT